MSRRRAHIWMRVVMAMGLVVVPIVPLARAQRPDSTMITTAATLSVLGGTVEHVREGGSRSQATSGLDLAEGDRIVTGVDGRALITFLDGSTITVEPASDVAVRSMDVGRQDRSHIRVLLMAGTVWARLASWLGGRATLTIESNAYSATAHDGLIGGQTRADGSFVCWTRAGTLEMADRQGVTLAVLQPGQKATATAPSLIVEPFAVHQSALEVSVNQVFGSLTASHRGAPRVVEVPAGAAGPYRVVLTGVENGPYAVTVVGRYQGGTVYRWERRGDIRVGERQGLEVTQGMSNDPDPRTARVVVGVVRRLGTLDENPAPHLTLSPLERANAVP
jgi:FecR protein